MVARIYQPARNTMQSGTARSKSWVLEFPQSAPRSIDPLMGWTSSGDTQAQVTMRFETRQAAIDYAEEHGIDYTIRQPGRRKPVVRKRGYAENFAYERRDAWTH